MSIKHFFLYALPCLFLATAVQAQDDDFRKKAPEPGPAPKIELGEYEQFTLENGLEVIVVENHKLPKVTFQLLVDVPQIAQGNKAGLEGMAGEMLSRGTSERSKAEIDQAVDFIGASLSTSSNGAFASSLSKHKETLMEIMAEVVLQPAFPEEEFGKVKQQNISSLALRDSDPSSIVSTVSDVMRYGSDHPYGEVVTETTLNNITLEDAKSYYNTYFKPNISYLAFIGDINMEEAKKLAEQYFGDWESGNVQKEFYPRPTPPDTTVVDFVHIDGATQSNLAITYPINLKRGTDDAITANVLNAVLGGGGLSSRLNKNIREDKGYTYGVYSTISPDQLVGYFSAGGSVRNEVTDSAVVAMLEEIGRLRTELVPVEELKGIKAYLFGSFARSTERPETVARFALNTARFKLPKDYYRTYLEKVDAVTPEDLMKVAQKYILPDQAHIVVVGNKDEVAKPLERVGEVKYFDKIGEPIKAASSEIPEGLTGFDVIESYIEAIGGKDKLEAVEDMTIKMGTEVQGMAISMTMKRKEPAMMSMVVEMNGNPLNETRFDGEKGYMSQMGQKQPIEGEQAEDTKEQAMLFPEMSYQERGYKVEIAGIEQVEGEDAYKLTVESPDGKKTTEFYGVDSGLKLKDVAVQEGPQGETAVTNLLSDYREVNGVMVPYEMKVVGSMPMPMTMKVEEVKINSGLTAEEFKVE
jgi:predicted Zn-dependent peptidase